MIGIAFGVGWTPCIGPILGTILTLVAVSSTVLQGSFLLAIFSLGLGLPFILVAWGSTSAFAYIKKVNKNSSIISIIGGVFLIYLGILLLTNNLAYLLSWGFDTFDFINYDGLLDYM